MRNLFANNYPLTADVLSQQEARREAALSQLLAALVARPGVVSGCSVSAGADSKSVVIAPGTAIWPDQAGALQLIKIPAAQALTLPGGDGAYYVMLSGDAEARTNPVNIMGVLGPSTFYLTSERLAYAAGALRPAQGQVVTPGLALTPYPGVGLPLAVVTVAEGKVGIAANPPRAAGLAPATTPPTADEVAQKVLGLLPAPPSAQELAGQLHLPSTDEVVQAVLGQIPAPPNIQKIEAAVLATLDQRSAPQPQAYTLRMSLAMDSQTPAPRAAPFTLPAALPDPASITFTGRGSLRSVTGQRVIIDPDVDEILEADIPWAYSDLALVVGPRVGINGPNEGFYMSTLAPLRDPDTKDQQKTEAGVLRWQHVLQRYNPSAATPFTVADTVQVDGEAGGNPMSLGVLGDTLVWGQRPLPFKVSTALGEAGGNTLSSYVAGRTVRAADVAGISLRRCTLVVDGDLLITPLATAPAVLSEDTQ